MEIPALISIIGALVTVGGVLIQWRKSRSEINVNDTQGTANLSKALKDAVDALTGSLADRKALEQRVDELEAHKIHSSREIYNLHGKIENLNRDYAKETSQLHEQVATLQRQVTEGIEKQRTYRKLIERLVEILQKVDPKLLEGIELTDTLEKIKAVK